MKRIYLDNAAATRVRKEVFDAMLPYFRVEFGNPSAIYKEGRDAARALAEARESVAEVLKCSPGEIVFTSGGTESCNLAILGVVQSARYKFGCVHAITTKIEHSAVLQTFQKLEKEGVKVTYLDVDCDGVIDPNLVERAVCPNTVLVSVMYANNEIGTIEPLREISKVIRKLRSARTSAGKAKNFPLYFHSDACQAAGYLPLIVDKIGVDLLTLNGSKIYGPKGIGVLYVRKGTELAPLMFGGGQQMGLRPGTENVAGAVGFAKALELAQSESEKESRRLTKLRDWLIDAIEKTIPDCRLNGHRRLRLPNNLNFSFKGIEGESIVLHLDRLGISASTGSACTMKNFSPSHVLMAIGVSKDMAHGSLRLTLGRETTLDDCKYVAKVLPLVVKRLREISSVY